MYPMNIIRQITLVSLFILIGSHLLSAQNVLPEVPYIEVQGNAEKEIVPDMIFITAVIQERIQGKDKVTVKEQHEKLLNGLKKLSFPIENITLSDANAYYQRSKWRENEVVSSQQYEIKANTAEMTSAIFKLLDEIDITQAFISRVDHSKIEDFKNELRVLAMKAAKTKSDRMLQAIGHSTGKALVVRENEIHQPILYNKLMRQEMIYASDAGGIEEQPQIDFRKIKISTHVYVKFQIQ